MVSERPYLERITKGQCQETYENPNWNITSTGFRKRDPKVRQKMSPNFDPKVWHDLNKNETKSLPQLRASKQAKTCSLVQPKITLKYLESKEII